jgi:hypothetical protein
MKEKENHPQIKSCFSHIGGKFGNRLTVRLEELGWITKDTKSKDFFITAKGRKEFKKLGVDISDL